MGTSSNQPSPKTPSWGLANAVLGQPSASMERQHQELWRAAIGDQGDALLDALGSPLLANACVLSTKSSSPSEAIGGFEQSLLDSHNAGLMLDLGKRALATRGSPRTRRWTQCMWPRATRHTWRPCVSAWGRARRCCVKSRSRSTRGRPPAPSSWPGKRGFF